MDLHLIPRRSNQRALLLRGERQWPLHPTIEAHFRSGAEDDVVRLRGVGGDDLAHQLGLARHMVRSINEDIDRHSPGFRPQVLAMIRGRRAELARRSAEYERTMRELGVVVERKAGAVEPVDVRIKRGVEFLRAAPINTARPHERALTAESVRAIVELIDQAGRGFEQAPGLYGKLDEEDLRDIILGYLNAVFTSNAATGETFSRGARPTSSSGSPGARS